MESFALFTAYLTEKVVRYPQPGTRWVDLKWMYRYIDMHQDDAQF